MWQQVVAIIWEETSDSGSFNSKMNASHDDILYAPPKTPEINRCKCQMHKNGSTTEIFANYEPTSWLLDQVSSEYPVEKICSGSCLNLLFLVFR